MMYNVVIYYNYSNNSLPTGYRFKLYIEWSKEKKKKKGCYIKN